MTVFVSVASYWLGKTLGLEGARAELQKQLQEPNGPNTLSCVHTIHRLRHLCEVHLYLDTGATCIGKARSRAFHAALQSRADAWISCDDDVTATTETLRWMLEALDSFEPRIVIAPCTLRQAEAAAPVVNIQMPAVKIERKLASGGELVQVEGGGFALVACNRAALTHLADVYGPKLRYIDDDQVQRIALFHDELSDGRWYGEDLSFFRRARAAGISIEALTTGITKHDGYVLELAGLQ